MKFLNLETGQTYDGIWKNTISYSNWTINDRSVPIKCSDCNHYTGVNDHELNELKKQSNVQIVYTSDLYTKDPNDSTKWSGDFDFENTCKYAFRTEIPQTKGYIHWFPHEQSTGIIYNTPFCILTDNDSPLTLEIEENKVFAFVTTSNVTNEIDGYTFIEPEFYYEYTTTPQKLDKYYAHVFNIACKSEISGEYICKVTIDDEHFFRVGVDLYGEYESVYINLSNMGIELPDMIQKAIYDVDPHEDVKNNIIINRKFKELLINYWDIVANKGSYKSLVNSLKWFEWNNIEIKELWKHLDAGRFIFDDRQIMSLFENKLSDIQNNFIKTSCIAIYCSLYDELDEYDEELNPVISRAVLEWSKEDLRLKMALLANFFGAHFMPIHLSLKHAVVEDKVFTNTIKNIYAGESKRDDLFGDFGYVECNIKDKQRFELKNVRAQVSQNTVYGIKEPGNISHFGVDIFPTDVKIADINTFASQYYTGPGVIIPIKFVLPEQEKSDFVKQTIINYDNNRLDFYDKIYTRNGNITINFNLLLKVAKDYSYKFTFILASGKTLIKEINFSVSDPDSIWINVYKILSKDDSNGFKYEDFKDTSLNRYFFRIQENDNTQRYYKRYLPYMLPTNENFSEYKGIKLNRTIILEIQPDATETDINIIRNKMSKKYLEFTRYSGETLTYLTYISKQFYEDTPKILNKTKQYKINVIRNTLGFYPQFHTLKLLNGNSLEDYTITKYDSLCCIPVTVGKKGVTAFKYGRNIENAEWEFINKSEFENNIISQENSSQQPFVAKSDKSLLEPGFYGIKFRYKLSDDNSTYKECNICSAFRVV